MTTLSLGQMFLGVPIESLTIKIGTDANEAFRIRTRLVLKHSALQHCKDSLVAAEVVNANPSAMDYQVDHDLRDVLYEATKLDRDIAEKRIPPK